jgi:outer membrane protein TolC
LSFLVSLGASAVAFAQDKQPAYEDKVGAALASEPGGLTADEAAARAAARSPEVAAREAEIDIAAAGQNRTLARYVPTLTITASVTRTNPIDFDFGGGALSVGALNPGGLTVGTCPDGVTQNCVVDGAGEQVGAAAPQPFEIPRNNYGVVGDLRIPISDYLLSMQPARRASAADLRAARLRRAGEVEQAGLDARVAYYEWLRTRAQVAVAESALESALARLEDAKIGLASGTLAQADILQVQSLEASSRVALAEATSFEAVARTNLAVLIGAPPASIAVGEDVRGELAVPPVTLEAMLESARKNRPELRALTHAIRSAEEAATGTRSELLPRLDAIGSVTYANPNPNFFPPSAEWNTSWVIGLSLSWGIDRFFAGRAQKQELEANARLFEAQRAGLARGVILEVTGAWQAMQRAAAAVKLSRADIDAAEGAYSQRVALYQAGEATTTEVIEAELARFNASLRSINARIDLRIARARLDRAAGLGVAP